MGDNMLMADIGLVANAMTALQFEPDLVQLVTETLINNSDDLKGHDVTAVAPGWFGGSGNAHRIGVNTQMAHQAVDEEFKKLADALRGYSDIINAWVAELEVAEDGARADMAVQQTLMEEIKTEIIEVRDESSTDDIGDGHYTEPPAAPPSTDGSGS